MEFNHFAVVLIAGLDRSRLVGTFVIEGSRLFYDSLHINIFFFCVSYVVHTVLVCKNYVADESIYYLFFFCLSFFLLSYSASALYVPHFLDDVSSSY